jgi:ATP-dependent HslUV protease, peptidase subunit HslV
VSETIHATTVLGVHARGHSCMGGDGQVTFGQMTMKAGARKVRTMADGRVLAGFAGSAADAFTLFEKFEGHLDSVDGQIARAAVAMAKEWRSDRILRKLEAMLAVMNSDQAFILSGNGDIIEPDDGILAIGSGSPYALSAARALLRETELTAEEICRKSLEIAAEICIYTNDRIEVVTLDPAEAR